VYGRTLVSLLHELTQAAATCRGVGGGGGGLALQVGAVDESRFRGVKALRGNEGQWSPKQMGTQHLHFYTVLSTGIIRSCIQVLK
jgi:hypothetical protein